MVEHYLDRIAQTINENWNLPALTDFYLNDEGTAQDTTRGNSYTYGQMYQQMMRLGDMFRALNIKKGSHIAICGSNSANWAVSYLAIAAYQGVMVTILHSQTTEDIVAQIDFSDATVLFTDNDLWEELREQNLPKLNSVISLQDFSLLSGDTTIKIDSTTHIEQPCSIHFEHGAADNLAMICFTSGSTDVSKGVMLCNASISNNANIASNLFNIDGRKECISLSPFAHAVGLVGDILSHLLIGKHILILCVITPTTLINSVLLIKPYMLVSVPKVIMLLLGAHDALIKTLTEHCKLICCGGAAVDDVVETITAVNNIPLAIVYGQTETGASIVVTPYKQHRLKSCGKIVEGMTARISEEGEILAKGVNVMLGYYKDPEATAKKIDQDGWLHTGDTGYFDEDGYLYVTGRIGQDMIVLPNGENIHPEDIETKINALPQVAESIVVAREGKLVALVRLNEENIQTQTILNIINPQLPLYSQLNSVQPITQPLERTNKGGIKRYLYK